MDSILHHPPNNLPATLALVSSTKRRHTDHQVLFRSLGSARAAATGMARQWTGPGVASDCGCLLQEALKREEDK